MKTLYYDCFSGISGDLHLGALIDIGVPASYVLEELDKLGVSDEFTCIIEKGVKDGISGTKVKVLDHNNDGANGGISHHDNHHHGLRGLVEGIRHTLKGGHDHGYSEDHEHSHHNHDGHDHTHGEAHYRHVHGRNFKDIKELIEASKLSRVVKDLAVAIFQEIALAEAQVHNKPVEEVHFHEVGAIDSIVDIVGSAICLDYLKVNRIVSSPLEVGQGTVRCAHGILPVPAPATTLILKGVPITAQGADFEATTPTGAAIIKTIAHEFSAVRQGTIEAVGYGLGEKHNSKMPNVLRVTLMTSETGDNDLEYVVEANMDDMTGEGYDLLFTRLFDLGADDVYLTPIMMKKQRPAITLTVLCKGRILDTIKACIFKNSTTIGLRYYEVQRERLERRERMVETRWGAVPVKEAFYEGQCINQKPEYDACKAIALAEGLSLQEVQQAVQERLREMKQDE